MNRLHKSIATLLLLGPLWACSASRLIETTPKADVLILSPSYAVEANLGASPIEIKSTENLVRYQLHRKKMAPEYLLVLFPEKLGGSLPIKLSEGIESGESSLFGSYFDQILRAHRLILRGDVEGAGALIERIQGQYDDGYGTSILAGNVSLLKGNVEDARRRFNYAKGLLPDAPLSEGLLGPGGATK